MRLQVPRVRVENGWALGKFAGGFAQARRLTLGSSNLVYFCEPHSFTYPFVARFCREQMGRACPLCPGISDVDLFRYREGIINLNAEVSDGAFDFGVPEQS